MMMDKSKRFNTKKIFIFDIDGTLADSYGPIYESAAERISQLLELGKIVAFATDRAKDLVEEKVIKLLPDYKKYLGQIYILPAAGAALYSWSVNSWNEVYENRIGVEIRKEIVSKFKDVLATVDYEITKEYEPFILDKDGLMLSCAAMPDISDRERRLKWDMDYKKREKIVGKLKKRFPDLEVNIGGSTTVNILKKGINKSYGLKRLFDHLDIEQGDVLYFGDAMHEGGNDKPVKDMGVDVMHVKDPLHTIEILDSFFLENNCI